MHNHAHNPLMRYGLDDLPDGRKSALRQLVSGYLRNGEKTVAWAVTHTGIARNTFLALGAKPSRPQTLDKLEKLGIPRGELERAEAIDAQRRAGLVFSDDVYDVVIASIDLTASEKQMLTEMADVIRRHRSKPD